MQRAAVATRLLERGDNQRGGGEALGEGRQVAVGDELGEVGRFLGGMGCESATGKCLCGHGASKSGQNLPAIEPGQGCCRQEILGSSGHVISSRMVAAWQSASGAVSSR